MADDRFVDCGGAEGERCACEKGGGGLFFAKYGEGETTSEKSPRERTGSQETIPPRKVPRIIRIGDRRLKSRGMLMCRSMVPGIKVALHVYTVHTQSGGRQPTVVRGKTNGPRLRASCSLCRMLCVSCIYRQPGSRRHQTLILRAACACCVL